MDFFDLFFPKRCTGCGKLGNYLCNKCKSLQPLHPGQICPMCERPAILGRTHPGCQTPLSLDGATFIFQYQPPITNLIKHLKYRFARSLLEIIISWTVAELKKIDMPTKDFTLIPIPLHTLRSNWRGFNQAEILGREIAKVMGWKFNNDVLVRSRWRPPQTEVKKEESRKQNVRGIFSTNVQCPRRRRGSPKAAVSNHLILFDDVWTTGATMKEAAKALKRAGANFVWALTIAR